MEKKITGDDFAFATPPTFNSEGMTCNTGNDGLTKREYFSAMAMASILQSNPSYLWGSINRPIPASVATEATMYADALINALNQ